MYEIQKEIDREHERFKKASEWYIRGLFSYLIISGIFMYYIIFHGYVWLSRPFDYVTGTFNLLGALLVLYSMRRSKSSHKRYEDLEKMREEILEKHPELNLPKVYKPMRSSFSRVLGWSAFGLNMMMAILYFF